MMLNFCPFTMCLEEVTLGQKDSERESRNGTSWFAMTRTILVRFCLCISPEVFVMITFSNSFFVCKRSLRTVPLSLRPL